MKVEAALRSVVEAIRDPQLDDLRLHVGLIPTSNLIRMMNGGRLFKVIVGEPLTEVRKQAALICISDEIDRRVPRSRPGPRA